MIRTAENVLGRPIVLLERNDLRRRNELVGKAENILDLRGAERGDRLCIVNEHGHAGAPRFQRLE